MLTLFRTGLVASAMMIPLAVPALSQGVASFDGTYRGVSFQLDTPMPSTGRQPCVKVGNPIPHPLVISGGNARLPYTKAMGTQVVFQGAVGAGGTALMRDDQSNFMSLRLDAQGGASALLQYGNGCKYSFTWHK